jgi:hypothetical protein
MWPFRRRREETLNEQLLREAGLADDQSGTPVEPEEPESEQAPEPEPVFDADVPRAPRLSPTGRDDAARVAVDPDAVVSVRAGGIDGDSVDFVVLPNGDVIVDDEQQAADHSPFADAVEHQLERPYHAYGRREQDDLWTVTAYRVAVSTFHFDAGDSIELVSRDGALDLTVDGRPAQAAIPALETAGEAVSDDYVVTAERLDGDLWEIRATAL